MDRLEEKRSQLAQTITERSTQPVAVPLMVGEIMTIAPACIPAETTVLALVQMFRSRGFRHLLVTDAESRLLGVISDRDVLRWLGPQPRVDREALGQLTAERIMSRDLLTVGTQTPVTRATSIMLEHGISCLPVLAGETLVGILTASDLQVLLLELLEANPLLSENTQLAQASRA